jgi:hypothetical protein
MDSAADQEIPIESIFDQQQAFIDKFRELSSTPHPCITLTNIYKEIPITCPATLCEIKGHHLELQTSELQIAAIAQCQEAYIQSPLVGLPILGKLDDIDIRRSTVQLSNFSYRQLHVNSRSTVRVRFKKPISIIAYAGSNKISGVIHDISLGGCCINTLIRHGLENAADLQIALKLMDHATGLGLSMQIPCSLVRITGNSPPFMCILRFNHTTQSEQLLSIYINQRQLEILKELRESI